MEKPTQPRGVIQVLNDLSAIAALTPGFVYEYTSGCVNWKLDPDDDEARVPSCIIGHLLHKYHLLAVLPDVCVDYGITLLCRGLRDPALPGSIRKGGRLDGHFTVDAVAIMQLVQSAQDQGAPWGAAVLAGWQEAVEEGWLVPKAAA